MRAGDCGPDSWSQNKVNWPAMCKSSKILEFVIGRERLDQLRGLTSLQQRL